MNFGAFARAKELQKRILFTLFVLVIYRIGTYVPVPGIDPAQFAKPRSSSSSKACSASSTCSPAARWSAWRSSP